MRRELFFVRIIPIHADRFGNEPFNYGSSSRVYIDQTLVSQMSRARQLLTSKREK